MITSRRIQEEVLMKKISQVQEEVTMIVIHQEEEDMKDLQGKRDMKAH